MTKVSQSLRLNDADLKKRANPSVSSILPKRKNSSGTAQASGSEFVDKSRFQGMCYKAANWIYVGDTQGRRKLDVKNEYKNLSIRRLQRIFGIKTESSRNILDDEDKNSDSNDPSTGSSDAVYGKKGRKR